VLFSEELYDIDGLGYPFINKTDFNLIKSFFISLKFNSNILKAVEDFNVSLVPAI
jgi:hypothetical protein